VRLQNADHIAAACKSLNYILGIISQFLNVTQHAFFGMTDMTKLADLADVCSGWNVCTNVNSSQDFVATAKNEL